MSKAGFMQGVEYSHWLLSQNVDKGSFVVDATVGNGHDTVFLTELVGQDGKVIGFDVQKQALSSARKKLDKKNIKNVKLVHDGHENMNEYINTKNSISGILFNLGYLPGSDKEVITRPETTIEAISTGLDYLKPGGLIVLVVYVGHSGGEKEKSSLIKYTSQLDNKRYNILHYNFLNQRRKPPEVIAIRKRK